MWVHSFAGITAVGQAWQKRTVCIAEARRQGKGKNRRGVAKIQPLVRAAVTHLIQLGPAPSL